ncbi:MAG: hypothetical protein RLO50_09600 [Azospirillaceae bacterium]
MADTPLTLIESLSGALVRFALPGGEAVFHYGADGQARAVLADGRERRGSWAPVAAERDCYEVRWRDAEAPSRTRLLRDPQGLVGVDAASGEPRGRVVAIEPGRADV